MLHFVDFGRNQHPGFSNSTCQTFHRVPCGNGNAGKIAFICGKILDRAPGLRKVAPYYERGGEIWSKNQWEKLKVEILQSPDSDPS
jgi:hypothetical protein